MITIADWGIWSLYVVAFYLVLLFYRNSKSDTELYQWFLRGFVVKVLGGLLFVLVSVYYYRGDTILYFNGAQTLFSYLLEDPNQYFQVLFSGDSLPSEFQHITSEISYSKTAEEWFMVKILSVFCLLSCNSYIVLTLYMSLISFWGAWKLFKFFTAILPDSKWLTFTVVFLAPSLLFWGTGVLKDTITLALINYLIYVLYSVFEKKKIGLWIIISSLLSGYVIYNLKSYVILAFLPTVVYVTYAYFKDSISSQFLRFMAVPVIFISFTTIGFFAIQQLTEDTVYSSKNIRTHVKGFHSWHVTTGGSSYDLGEVELTTTGVIRKIPASLIVSFFRPYLWEARNLTSLIGAVESSVVLISFAIVAFSLRTRFLNIIDRHSWVLILVLILMALAFAASMIFFDRSLLMAILDAISVTLAIVGGYLFSTVLKHNKLLLGLMIFVLIFGFAVGFTSYNFGALSRYKMPIISLYAFAILYTYKMNKRLP